MKSIYQRLWTLLTALMMCITVFHISRIELNAEVEKTDIITAADRQETDEASMQGTWDIYENRPVKDLIHDDYVDQVRREAAARVEEIEFTTTYVPNVSMAASYVYSLAVLKQTGNPKEGDYLRWQTEAPDVTADVYRWYYQIYHLTFGYYTDAAQEAAVDEAVNSLIDRLGIRYYSDYLKAVTVYRWMYDNISYAQSINSQSMKTAYSALINCNADSQGFALLFYRLMMELGIDCRIIKGSTSSNSSWFWNIVKLGDEYYYCDIGQEASEGSTEKYMLCSAGLFGNHTPDGEYRTLEWSVLYPVALNPYEPTEEEMKKKDVCQGAFFTSKEVKVDENRTVQLETHVLPSSCSQNVTYTSSDTSVAVVNAEGLVTGIKEGTAWISAAAKDGGTVRRCKVTVEKVYPDSGYAYAIRVITDFDRNWGDLIFIRSKKNYELRYSGPIEDIWGNQYNGVVTGLGGQIEGSRCNYATDLPEWTSDKVGVLRAYVADNQLIHVQMFDRWFYEFEYLEEFNAKGLDFAHCKNSSQVFEYCKNLKKVDFSGTDTSQFNSFANWFYYCRSLEEQDLSSLDTSSAVSMANMFFMCDKLKSVNLSSFDTSKVTSMKNMFAGCSALEAVWLGKKFTVWKDNAYLPKGTWSNGIFDKTETELYEEYPAHAQAWNRRWVLKDKYIIVTGVDLKESSLNIPVSDTAQLNASVKPANASNQNIVWSSSDEAIASVDQNGLVTALKEGSCIIYARSEEDSFIYDYCSVTVRPFIHVQSVSVSPKTAELKPLDSLKLNAVISPAGAVNKAVTWSSSAPDVVSVSADGGIFAIKAGSAVITVTAEDGGFTDTCSVTVKEESAPLPDSITLNYYSAAVATQDTFKLEAHVVPLTADQHVIWLSSDEKVASVDQDGTVHVHRYGIAEITAASAVNSSVKKTCYIYGRFYDVNDDSKYYFKHVYWAADNGITTGYDRVYFGPQLNCTRKELCIFLYRMMGKPSAAGSLQFPDTKDKYSRTSDSYKAILWCSNQGIVKGYSDGTFRPDNPVTRKDTMIMLYRLAGKPSVSGSIRFPDVLEQKYSTLSDTYKAILWGTQKGITNGYKDGNFQPLSNCLREHIVTFIHRFDEQYN